MIESRATRFRAMAIGGGVLSWLVLGLWWFSGALTAQLVPAMLAIGAAALYTRRAELHAAALGASLIILIVWASVAGFGPWPTTAMVAGGVVAAIGLAWSAMASNRVPDTDRIVPPLRGSQLAPAGGTILLFLLLNIEIADFFATGDAISFNLSAGPGQNLAYTPGWAVFAVC